MVLVSIETSSSAARCQNIDGSNLPGNSGVPWHFTQAGYKLRRGVHAPQHFLYFLPLPQGQGSFLPVFGVARRI